MVIKIYFYYTHLSLSFDCRSWNNTHTEININEQNTTGGEHYLQHIIRGNYLCYNKGE